jgi:hypothetical protein
MYTVSINNGHTSLYHLTNVWTLIMIRDKCTNDNSITTDMTTENNQMFKKNESERNAVKYSCRACSNTFDAHRLTMSIGAHRCILAGNLTGLSGAMNAADAAKEPSCSGTPKCTSITTMPL